ncbi:hypothetical protein [Moraxella oblonga]|uniref:hypothetical protein n=1 Tax=Moraxella oblonga TaxID=200413 RepID=UPI000829558F|nr:hypothetical protein [Moraxella oblonga]
MNKIIIALCVILACNVMTSHAQNDSKDKDSKGKDKEKTTLSVPANPHNPKNPTLAELQKPDESELSQANTDLLAKNAELQSRVDELTTQVNVLVNERSGQMFFYGAMSVLAGLFVGIGSVWFIVNKNKSDW